jgi:hypothetical protein
LLLLFPFPNVFRGKPSARWSPPHIFLARSSSPWRPKQRRRPEEVKEKFKMKSEFLSLVVMK